MGTRCQFISRELQAPGTERLPSRNNRFHFASTFCSRFVLQCGAPAQDRRARKTILFASPWKTKRGCGGTGTRGRLKICWSKDHGSSILPIPTNKITVSPPHIHSTHHLFWRPILHLVITLSCPRKVNSFSIPQPPRRRSNQWTTWNPVYFVISWENSFFYWKIIDI